MNPTKMRHQRGRVRPTVRPTELAAHPATRGSWLAEVVDLGGGSSWIACAHCHRLRPCPTAAYLHGQDGHNEGCGGGITFRRCWVFEQARRARERELVP